MICFISSGRVDKLLKTFLISPTPGVENSFLSFPVLLPLSDTVMIAVISIGKYFKPLKIVEVPVPPPKTTIFFSFHYFLLHNWNLCKVHIFFYIIIF